MGEHVPNSRLTVDSVPSGDADFGEVIFPFAMTFDAYGVWGDFETVRTVAEPIWAAQAAAARLPESLTKLRTSLFAAARYMRTTDFDEDITGAVGSEAAWIETMREHVRLIRIAVERGSARHLEIARATTDATAQIAERGTAKEHDLSRAIGEAISVASQLPVLHEHRFEQLPFWSYDDPPGPFDVVVGDPDAPSMAVEVKLSDHNTMSHLLWDIAKLFGVLAASADHVFLVGGYPAHLWKTAEFSALCASGPVSLLQLPIENEWPSLLAHSKGTPLRIPSVIESTEVARVAFRRHGEPWEMRAVAIEPTADGWIELQDGALDATKRYQPD